VSGQIELVQALHDDHERPGRRLVRRVDIVPSHHSSTDSRVTSDCASSALWGSSTTTRSPPYPVATPSTEVAMR